MKKIIPLFLTILFTAAMWQGAAQTGSTCTAPIVVTNVPFNNSGNTSTYGNNYGQSDVPPTATGAVTNGTGSNYYLTGDDVVFSYTAGSNGNITISTTNDDDWVALWVFTGCPFASTVGYHTATSGTTRSISNLPVVANETYYIVISTWASPQSTNFSINITGTQVANPPSCLAPTLLNVSNETATSVDLGWTENGTATTWDIEWGAAGFTPSGTPTVAGVTTNPYNLTGLTASTQYDFYVRADCGAGDLSTWSGPYTFMTACANQLSGTYTIGATGDYTSLSAAISVLNECGVSGPVIFDVITGSGPYNEQVAITDFMGASSTNTVTINGNGETITASTTSGARSLFLLDGAKHVTINGFNMETIEATDNFVVHLLNGADHNTITNNTIDLTSTLGNTGSTNAGIVASNSLTSATTAGDTASNLTITGNTVIGGYYGIIINGSSSSVFSTNNDISNNTVQDFYYYGIYMKSVADSNISENEIHRENRTNTSVMYGLYFSVGGENNLINANIIHDTATSNPSSSSSTYGIYHSSHKATVGNHSIVSNNVLYNFNTSSGIIYGLYNSGSDNVHYYHNTVSLDFAGATGGTTRGFYQTGAASDIIFKNNIISITRGGSGAKYAMYYGTASSTITSDHNDLYVNAMAGTNGIGYLGSAQTTLADWQVATSGDLNSVDADPIFEDPLAGNLIPTNPAVDNLGTPIAAVTTDVLGNPRSATTPDMGAYEFVPPTCPKPSNLVANNVTQNSLHLSWTESGSANEWEIEYGPAGFTQGNGTVIIDNDGTVGELITGLSPETEYDYYVRAICSPTDSSQWTDPLTVKTECNPAIAPFFDDVEAHTAITHLEESLCWKADSDSNYDWNILGSGTTPSSGTGPAAAYSGTKYFYVEASDGSSGDEARLYSPLIDISGLANVELSFYYHMYGNEIGTLHVDIFDGTSWANSVDSIVGEQQTSDTDPWLKKTISLAAYSGTIKVRFRAVSAGTFKGDISIDDIAVDGTPVVCDAPSAIVISNITDTTADIAWTENGTATEWEIEYGPSGFAQGSGTVIVDNDGVIGETLTGLDAETGYDVYVRAMCSSSNTSTWVGPEAFTTLETPCADPSDIVIANVTDTQAEISWTENGTAAEWLIEYGPTGFTLGTGTFVVDNNGTLGETLTGLTPETSYDVYVQAVCSATNTSNWVGPETFTTDATVNVRDNEFSGFTYYPNPMNEVINLSSQDQMFDIAIYNMVGQRVLSHTMDATNATIDVSNLASGTYLMKVTSKSGASSEYRLIKE